ncbi:mavicyanin isoform X2 [Brachypodium distachyon]|nr:mavicyanin isoform X2 [Brachypodium distachyon]|eukprot:XP_024311396.1 mavicyanin isoform X2 [Brachypodium distachyon]
MANQLLPLAMLVALCCYGALATDFEVGGDAGWAVPPAADPAVYNHWASNNRFLLGDSVHFKYKKDSVMVVTEEEYGKCASTRPVFFSNNGDTEVRLDRAGAFYFISGVAGHCERGQRMIVRVIGPDSPPPAPPAPPTPPHPSAAAPLPAPGVLTSVAVAGAAMTFAPVILRGA